MKVLVVDDSRTSRVIISQILLYGGFEVREAENGVEALKLLEKETPDIIISDILMPVMDGFKLLKNLNEKRRTKTIPFVFYTSNYVSEEDMEFGLSLGASRFLLKPMSPMEILSNIKSVLNEFEAGKPGYGKLLITTEKYLEKYNERISLKLESKIIELEEEIEKRNITQEALQQSEKKYRTLIDNIQDGVFIILDVKLQFVNEAFAKMVGYSMEEIIGKDFREIVAPEDMDMVTDRYSRRLAGEDIPKEYEFHVLHRNGEKRIVNMNVGLINYMGRMASMGTLKDITQRKQAQERISQSLVEKEILLREVHHRVKNNMQIISSMLQLQSDYIEEKKYKEIFKDSQNRILTMSLVHEKLYQSSDFARIDIENYVRDMVNMMLESYGASADKIKLNLNIEDVSLGVDLAIPCGLIINELVTNAIKYAFPDDRKGEIGIKMIRTDKNDIELVIMDNGVGIPEDVNVRKSGSMGLYLVRILAENQLDGEMNLSRSNGTEFRIKFKGGK